MVYVLGYRIGGGLSYNRRNTGGLLLGNGYSVPVERLSDCTHVRNGGVGIGSMIFTAKRYISSACFYV